MERSLERRVRTLDRYFNGPIDLSGCSINSLKLIYFFFSRSPEYKSIPKEERKKFGFVTKEDGEFWISYNDWKEFFSDYEICYLNLNLFADSSNYDQMAKKNWEIGMIEGEWVIGASAGGSLNEDIGTSKTFVSLRKIDLFTKKE